MRILLDLQGCQSASRLRGIGRYTLALAKAIARNSGEHEIWLLLSDLFPGTVMPLRQDFAGLIPDDRIVVFSAPGPVAEYDPANSPRARAGELIREHAIAELQPDVVHLGSLFEGFPDDAVTSVGRLTGEVLTSVTLYDLIPLLNPEQYLDCGVYRDYYLRKIESLKRADLLLAISESAGREAVSALQFAATQIIDIASAADARFQPVKLGCDATQEFQQRLGLSKPFVFYIGAIEPRKNFEGLIHAFAMLPPGLREAHQLLLVAQGEEGAREGLRGLASSVGLRPTDLVLIEHVSDDDLVTLYNLCRLFVFPSLHEGFGLPALEAMQCGAAVIGSNTTSIPELIGREDALFDPASPISMAKIIGAVLSDDAFCQSLKEHGRRQAKKFSWDATARRTLRALEALHERRCTRGEYVDGATSVYRRLISSIMESDPGLSELDIVRVAEAISVNLVSEGLPQILVDVSELAERDACSGIQRVTRAILKQLLVQPPAGFRVEPIRFDSHTLCYRYARAFANGFVGNPTAVVADDYVEAGRGDFFLGLDLVLDRLPSAVAWLATARRRGVKVACVVYDLLLLKHPDWWPPGMQELMERWIEAAASVSDIMVGISEAVVDDLRDWFTEQQQTGQRPLLRSFHLGADFGGNSLSGDLPAEAASVLAQFTSGPTFLMVGTLEPRKGHSQVLSGFEALWQGGLDANLVIVGKNGWMAEDLVRRLRGHSRLGTQLFWLESISDEFLEQVYAASTCLIAASEGEGFGLPLIEAAQHRLPIIARNLPVFQEVAGEHAYYFAGKSPQAIADAVRNWLTLHDRGESPSCRGLHWLTWAESAMQLMATVLEPDIPLGDAVREDMHALGSADSQPAVDGRDTASQLGV